MILLNKIHITKQAVAIALSYAKPKKKK